MVGKACAIVVTSKFMHLYYKSCSSINIPPTIYLQVPVAMGA
jgi:hypothetical protein